MLKHNNAYDKQRVLYQMEFRDLKTQYRYLKPQIDAAVREVIESGQFILGNPVTRLEEELAEYVGRKHCVGVANGTEALQLSLMAMDIGPGDAVFTSDFTYFASAGCASIIGATPVFVDIDLKTFNLDPEHLEKQIQKVIALNKLKPKVIIPVDLFGLPADYGSILPIAEKYGLKVLEDAAQGFGGRIGNRIACSFGEISATSFFPAKPLGCYGDGGAVFTDDDQTDARLRSLRASGKSAEDKYDNREVGLNSRLDTIQAAILLPKLKAFREYELENVNHVADLYTERLKQGVITPTIPDGFLSSWAQYTILLEDSSERNEIRARLKEQEIPSMIYYPRGLHQQKAYAAMQLEEDEFRNTIEATKRALSLPIHPYMTEDQVDKVCKAVLE